MADKYVVTVTYKGFDPDYDCKLEKAAGRGGLSGLGFGERDIQWNYKTKREAETAAKKLRRFRKYGIQVSVDSYPDWY